MVDGKGKRYERTSRRNPHSNDNDGYRTGEPVYNSRLCVMGLVTGRSTSSRVSEEVLGSVNVFILHSFVRFEEV